MGEPHENLSDANADVWIINDEKLVTVYWDENDKLQTASVSTVIPSYYTKPQDTQLEFRITKDVASADFSACSINPGWMGATGYYGKGYADGDTEFVSYLVSAYSKYGRKHYKYKHGYQYAKYEYSTPPENRTE